MEYIGTVNGAEAYYDAIRASKVTFDAGQWARDRFCCDKPEQLDKMRRTLIKSQSMQRCLAEAQSVMKTVCSFGHFLSILPELIDIISMYLSTCYPWSIHPVRELPVPLCLDRLDVTNMARMDSPRELYSGITAWGLRVIVTRDIQDNMIKWYSVGPSLAGSTLAHVMLEARRNEILKN